VKKEQQQEESFKQSLTKIKYKFNRDGKIYVRFPQGLLIPKILNQKPLQAPQEKKCEVLNCTNKKRYRDPKSKLFYCSVKCYKDIKNTMDIN
jgi:hypothetical protein